MEIPGFCPAILVVQVQQAGPAAPMQWVRNPAFEIL